MKKLHPKQAEILKLLKKNLENPLTIRELGAIIGVDSPSVVHHHLTALEKKGYIKRNPQNPRDYVLLDSPEKPIAYINKYGTAQCGPNGSILDGNPIERIPIASNLLKFPASEAFIVEAKGDSMEPKIRAGDIVIAKRQNVAENGDIVVCVYQSKAIIKKLSYIGEALALISLNQEKYHPLLVTDEQDLRIEGIVKNVLSY